MNWKPDQSHRDPKWLQELIEEIENPVFKKLQCDEYKKAIIEENTRNMQTEEIPDQDQQELAGFEAVESGSF
jgi:hypothetical protein